VVVGAELVATVSVTAVIEVMGTVVIIIIISSSRLSSNISNSSSTGNY
jgi:hypothetical protein